MQKSRTLSGVLLASGGAVLWGISGIFGKLLFEGPNAVTPAWLTAVRMLLAGGLLLLYSLARHGDPLAVWRTPSTAIRQILYGVLGLLPVQFFYFLAVDYGNASIATILQFLGPIVIALYYVIFKRQLPSRAEAIGMLLALLGTFILVTHGHFNQLVVAPLALFWGLMSALAIAGDTLLPRPLLPKFGSINVNAWGLLVGGVQMNFIQPVWVGVPQFTWQLAGEITVVVLFGTLIAYVMYSNSLLYITPTTASLLDAFEPLAATILSIIFFSIPFAWADAVGGILIVLAVVMLSLNVRPFKKRRK
ncbi:EamA family transporter [Loigolactobacillus coryniformis]|jgi:drug/metabolite transporter (DMT)-like permease|uniref:DMT family permease n=3 Tax=Loigolactobacillus coryniformis TaxID=1610 RepID=A0A0R1F4T0_9LACO|nr:EamA family transporter [Loigolactobacillus coryniformis]OEH90981.1 multidrug transporter [Loigolactobacillus coryniformis subsp. coryniformis]ATO54224.1 multidrug transporter [Loigolactobacillus coryniformis subsp. coryniformis KCTC 3167 = DSM 20001]KRK14162.1 DMT family permease [Loigolactobacillus coryniformis subsp. coryniformis KCTC 3167 = DSM 20001]MBW4801299.1 EamA family transporter [Loigolactobacillus coryniformis subsp. torquens]MBW4804001.1 EamA family transporter [Loigolactobaci